jgi:hypothetical protein
MPRTPPAPAGPAGRCLGWAFRPAPRPLSTSARVGRLPRLPAGPACRLGYYPGWAPRPARPGGLPPVQTRLGRIRRIRHGRDYSSRPLSLNTGWAGLYYFGWAAFYALFRPGQAGIPWPRSDYSSPGPRFTPSGSFSSFNIDSTAWCRS